MAAEAFGYAAQTVSGVAVSQDDDHDAGFRPGQPDDGQHLRHGDCKAARPRRWRARPSAVLAGSPLSTTTAADGAYTLANVPTGARTVRMTSPGYQTLSASVTVAGAETLDFTPAAVPDYAVGDGGDTCSAEYAWIDATGGDGVQPRTTAPSSVWRCPGAFTFYGNDYNTRLRQFQRLRLVRRRATAGGTASSPSRAAPNNQIIGLGEDLNPASGAQGTIYTQDLGDGRFVIEYHAGAALAQRQPGDLRDHPEHRRWHDRACSITP